MRRVYSFEQLARTTRSLFVEVVCPKCRRVLISATADAKIIVVFGCLLCADIDSSMLLAIGEYPRYKISDVNIPMGDIPTEEIV
jgi:ribosomal protein S27E